MVLGRPLIPALAALSSAAQKPMKAANRRQIDAALKQGVIDRPGRLVLELLRRKSAENRLPLGRLKWSGLDALLARKFNGRTCFSALSTIDGTAI
jgi:hypothetical protein